MIYVDDRTGSVELIPVFQSHRAQPAVMTKRLAAADMCFTGQGPEGLPVMVGIERKSIVSGDMLSSMRTGRFSGEQLPKLLDNYEFPFLIVEGWDRVRINYQTGLLEKLDGRYWRPLKAAGQQPVLALELTSFLSTIETMTPVKIHYTDNERGTVEDLVRLQHWFSTPWDKHTGHVALHRPQQYATIGKASTVRRVAADLDKVGWERSMEVATHFPSVAHMICSDPQRCIECGYARPVEDWQELDGFGKVMAKKVYDELHGFHKENVIE